MKFLQAQRRSREFEIETVCSDFAVCVIAVPLSTLSTAWARGIVIAIIGVIGLATSSSALEERKNFSNSQEILVNSDFIYFPKWKDVVKRYKNELKQCNDPTLGFCYGYIDWNSLLTELRDKNKMHQLRVINNYGNHMIEYRIHEENCGIENSWATPKQALEIGGNCIDIAFFKYVSLKRLDWTDGSIRVVVLYNSKINKHHAIVMASDNGKNWALDNEIEDVIEAEEITHYDPLYSINEKNWWVWRRKKDS